MQKNILIIIVIILILIIVIYFLNKRNIIRLPFSGKNTIEINANANSDKPSKCDISIMDNCKCNVKYSDKLKPLNNYSVDLNSYDLEKEFYKVKQDLVPYWKPYNQCTHESGTPLYIKTSNRITDSKNFYYDENNKTITKTEYDSGNIPSYQVNACDIIPCKNLGYIQKNNPTWSKNNNDLVCDKKYHDFNNLDPIWSNTKFKKQICNSGKNLTEVTNDVYEKPQIRGKILNSYLTGLNFNNCEYHLNDGSSNCKKRNKNIFNILSKKNSKDDKQKESCSNIDRNNLTIFNEIGKHFNANNN
jgi:hypothetical protein